MGIKQGFPYKLYYDKEFVFDQPHVSYKPEPENDASRLARTAWRAAEVKKSLVKDGMRNPCVVYISKGTGIWKLHPGKCRVTAARELGWVTVPALIVDKTLSYAGPGEQLWEDEAEDLFSDDMHVVWDEHKFCPRLSESTFSGEVKHPTVRVIRSATK